MKKRAIAMVLAIVMCSAVGYAAARSIPSVAIINEGSEGYTVVVKGLTKGEAQDIEELVSDYLDGNVSISTGEYYVRTDAVSIAYFLDKNGVLYSLQNGSKVKIDTLDKKNIQIGIDKKDGLVWINSSGYGMYIPDTKYPTTTKTITKNGKALNKSSNYVTGIKTTSGTEETSFITNNSKNAKPIVLYIESGSTFYVVRGGYSDKTLLSNLNTSADLAVEYLSWSEFVLIDAKGGAYNMYDPETAPTRSLEEISIKKKAKNILVTGGQYYLEYTDGTKEKLYYYP